MSEKLVFGFRSPQYAMKSILLLVAAVMIKYIREAYVGNIEPIFLRGFSILSMDAIAGTLAAFSIMQLLRIAYDKVVLDSECILLQTWMPGKGQKHQYHWLNTYWVQISERRLALISESGFTEVPYDIPEFANIQKFIKARCSALLDQPASLEISSLLLQSGFSQESQLKCAKILESTFNVSIASACELLAHLVASWRSPTKLEHKIRATMSIFVLGIAIGVIILSMLGAYGK